MESDDLKVIHDVSKMLILDEPTFALYINQRLKYDISRAIKSLLGLNLHLVYL